jgi:hypothetical protein
MKHFVAKKSVVDPVPKADPETDPKTIIPDPLSKK